MPRVSSHHAAVQVRVQGSRSICRHLDGPTSSLNAASEQLFSSSTVSMFFFEVTPAVGDCFYFTVSKLWGFGEANYSKGTP